MPWRITWRLMRVTGSLLPCSSSATILTALPRLAGRLGEIEVPCQIIVGRHDPFVPVSNAEGLHKGLPKSKLDILDCGHFVWEDAAAEYGKLASDWIKGGYEKSQLREVTRPRRHI